ncbi:hypothetical protein QOZ80_1AG0008070 [Eleusine coracana subsp. coracana]|nr:hypothetical protein QOZ80_1AG0008070 [Eleusine coracana subsp. coracana]
MKSVRKSFVIFLLQAALVMGILAALAVAKEDGIGAAGETKASDDVPCCNDCKDLFSGIVRCDDVGSKCRAGCTKCVLEKGRRPGKLYKCADTYFGPCNKPCKKG